MFLRQVYDQRDQDIDQDRTEQERSDVQGREERRETVDRGTPRLLVTILFFP